MGQNNSIIISASLSALILSANAQASAQASITNDFIRKVFSPNEGEEIYLYATIAVSVFILYMIYA